MKFGGRDYTRAELTAKLRSMPPRAYVRNLRRVAGGPGRRASISAATWAGQRGRLALLFGYRDPDALRAWVRGDAWVLPWARSSGLKETIRNAIPDLDTQSRDLAERALRREFDLLGSGPHAFVGDIDWLTDFKTGIGWAPEYYAAIDYANFDRPSDVKIPWEMSRAHQLVVLSKAYLLTGSQDPVQEIADQLRSWIDANPLGRTVNWSCTMEVAIRAVNWTWTLAAVADQLDDESLDRVIVSLLQHGMFISQNLEVSEIAGNHYISDALGLVALGSFFRNSKLGGHWLVRGRNILVEQMEAQVYTDGVDHEMSIPYHRLVAEIFLLGGVLLRASGEDPPSDYWVKLERMLEFTLAYTRPDGSVPIWGDADDGRVVHFGERHLDSHQHLLSTGAVLFRRSDFAAGAGGFAEDTGWLLGPKAADAFSGLKGEAGVDQGRCRVFGDGGFVVLRTDTQHVLMDAGPVGLRGRGGHGHNDACAVELWTLGAPLLIDPGCYAYTGDVGARYEYRSALAHNSPVLEDEESNEVIGLWQLRDDARARIEEAGETENGPYAVGVHEGYTRFREGAGVRRRVQLSAASCTVTDDVGELGAWTTRWTLTPGATLTLDGDTAHVMRGGRGVQLRFEGADALSVVDAWVAPSYGRREAARALLVRFTGPRTRMVVEIG